MKPKIGIKILSVNLNGNISTNERKKENTIKIKR